MLVLTKVVFALFRIINAREEMKDKTVDMLFKVKQLY